MQLDFEFFDPQPHDFHGLKTLLRQLLDVDAQSIDLSALAEMILAQPLLGSTVKVDGNESDPYAFLSILNLRQHKVGTLKLASTLFINLSKENPVIKALIEYLSGRAETSSVLEHIPKLLHQDSSSEVGLVLTDRLLNMPSELVPPMYRMLVEEVTWAVEEKEPYTFSHYLVLSKTYTEAESSLDQEDDRPKKKKKRARPEGNSETFYFHPEDEILHKHALAHANYSFAVETFDGNADSRRAFQEMGIKPQGHMVLIEAAKFEDAVEAIGEYLRTP